MKSPLVSSSRLALPLGISGEEPTNATVGSLAFATDTDLARVKTSLGWANIGSGTVSSIVTATPALVSITNPGGPVVTVDVSAFADSVRSAPTTPNAFDDEFDDGSADLATRGFVVWRYASSAAMTWVGEVDLTDTSLTSLQYRASIHGSQLIFQPPPTAGTNDLAIVKTLPSDPTARYAMRVSRGYSAIASGQRDLRLFLSADAFPFFLTDWVQMGLTNPGSNNTWRLHTIGTNAGVYYEEVALGAAGSGIRAPYEFPSMFVYDREPSADLCSFYYDSGASVTWNTKSITPRTYINVGIYYQYAISAGSPRDYIDSVFRLDFLRRMPYLGEFV